MRYFFFFLFLPLCLPAQQVLRADSPVGSLNFSGPTQPPVIVPIEDPLAAQRLSHSPKNLKCQALVIGNAAYTSGPLANAKSDARAVATALREVGFTVREYPDLPYYDRMRAVIDSFEVTAQYYDVNLIYYSGHGVSAKGKNYLVPVREILSTEEVVEYKCISAERIAASVSIPNKVNLLILDACRDNPYARSWNKSNADEGLKPMQVPPSCIVAYATGAGRKTPDNGIYANELATLIRTQGLSLSELLNRLNGNIYDKTRGAQTPYTYSSFVPEFYFRP